MFETTNQYGHSLSLSVDLISTVVAVVTKTLHVIQVVTGNMDLFKMAPKFYVFEKIHGVWL